MDVEYEANFLFMVDFRCIWGYIYNRYSVKPFKSKNRDKIHLDAPNLKKGGDKDFRATA